MKFLEETRAREGLPRNVWLTGMTSFFTDVSSEMVYPLFQAFLTAILAAKKAMVGPVLGIMEGTAEAAASLLRVVAGYISDRQARRKPWAISGYSISVLGKILFLLATPVLWLLVPIARVLDRVGKGLRSAPRDALISESVALTDQGKAFGFQRAMDFAGATLGSAIAFLLVQKFMDEGTGQLVNLDIFYKVFAISLIPAVVGVYFLFFIQEKQADNGRERIAWTRPRLNLHIKNFTPKLRIFFIAQAIFTIGNSSNQFLLLRSMNLGFSLSLVILQYMLLNLITSLFATFFGSLSDRVSRRKILLIGYMLYAVIYAGFGLIQPAQKYLLWVFWPLYGFYYALTEGVEKAFVTENCPMELKGTALGFQHTIVGLGLLPASIFAGLLLYFSPAAPFIFGSFCAIVSVLVLYFSMKPENNH